MHAGWAEATRCLNTHGCEMQDLQLNATHSSEYQSEYSTFSHQPLQFLQSRWTSSHKGSKPTHVVMFQNLVPALSRFLAEQNLTLQKTFFNCHFQVDAGSRIWVWKVDQKIIH